MFRASWRHTVLLLREFRTALIVFLFAIVGGGVLYYSIAQQVGEPMQNLSEAIYVVLHLHSFSHRELPPQPIS